MPRKAAAKTVAPDCRQEIADEIIATLREMDELSAEPLADGSGLVAVVGFIDMTKIVDRLVAKESRA